MAVSAYGKRRTVEGDRVVYEFGEYPDEGPRGTFAIRRDGSGGWFLADADRAPREAGLIYAKVMREYRRSGEWPAFCGFNA